MTSHARGAGHGESLDSLGGSRCLRIQGCRIQPTVVLGVQVSPVNPYSSVRYPGESREPPAAKVNAADEVLEVDHDLLGPAKVDRGLTGTLIPWGISEGDRTPHGKQ